MQKNLLSLSNDTQWADTKIPDRLKEYLTENNACYVLITCGKPSTDGKMQVEMSYEGDACLAAYLLESAHEILDEEKPTL